MPHVLVWDIETVPDLSGFAAANDLFDIILCQSCLASPNAENMSGFRSFIQKMEVVRRRTFAAASSRVMPTPALHRTRFTCSTPH